MNRPDFNEMLPLARRHPFSVACAVVSVISLLASFFLWQDVGTLEATHYVRSQEGEGMLTTLVSGPLLRQELANVRSYTKRIEDNLVLEDNRGENYAYFYDIEGKSKARLTELRQFAAMPVDSGVLYKRIPYTLRVTGPYLQVAAFVQAVENGPRMASITTFNMRRQGAGSALVVVDMSVVLLGKL